MPGTLLNSAASRCSIERWTDMTGIIARVKSVNEGRKGSGLWMGYYPHYRDEKTEARIDYRLDHNHRSDNKNSRNSLCANYG